MDRQVVKMNVKTRSAELTEHNPNVIATIHTASVINHSECALTLLPAIRETCEKPNTSQTSPSTALCWLGRVLHLGMEIRAPHSCILVSCFEQLPNVNDGREWKRLMFHQTSWDIASRCRSKMPRECLMCAFPRWNACAARWVLISLICTDANH